MRHELSRILNEGGSSEPALYEASITVSEVRVSPDLKNATVFVMPLGGGHLDEILPALKRAKPFFRHQVAKAMRQMRSVPDLKFVADDTIEQAARIETILKNI